MAKCNVWMLWSILFCDQKSNSFSFYQYFLHHHRWSQEGEPSQEGEKLPFFWLDSQPSSPLWLYSDPAYFNVKLFLLKARETENQGHGHYILLVSIKIKTIPFFALLVSSGGWNKDYNIMA